MSNSIFSTYSQGENRVASTIIHVLRNLPINVVERFLGMFADADDQNFFAFKNQVRGENSVPDAEISSNFKLLFETKTVPNGVRKEQLNAHLNLCTAKETTLVYLTPDNVRPSLLDQKAVIWKSFADVYELINELCDSSDLVLSERDQFLLRNLQGFFEETGLLPTKDECVIVAARTAWPVYLKHGIYVCQVGRNFKPVDWIGFYCDGEIKPKIARIRSRAEVNLPAADEFAKVDLPPHINSWLSDPENEWAFGESVQVFEISGATDSDTRSLEGPINNDLKNNAGRGYAYTQGQRYTSMGALEAAKTTKDLDAR